MAKGRRNREIRRKATELAKKGGGKESTKTIARRLKKGATK